MCSAVRTCRTIVSLVARAYSLWDTHMAHGSEAWAAVRYGIWHCWDAFWRSVWSTAANKWGALRTKRCRGPAVLYFFVVCFCLRCVVLCVVRVRAGGGGGHRTQRPTERSDPTQHAKGRTGDCPGPRKETTTGRNVTRGGSVGWGVLPVSRACASACLPACPH